MTPYRRTLIAEPRLRTIEVMVESFVQLAPTGESGKAMCVGCIWESILKPLITPLVGWGRALPRKIDREAESWLSGAAAWDAVTERWLDQLSAVDPKNGHGIGARVDSEMTA